MIFSSVFFLLVFMIITFSVKVENEKFYDFQKCFQTFSPHLMDMSCLFQKKESRSSQKLKLHNQLVSVSQSHFYEILLDKNHYSLIFFHIQGEIGVGVPGQRGERGDSGPRVIPTSSLTYVNSLVCMSDCGNVLFVSDFGREKKVELEQMEREALL